MHPHLLIYAKRFCSCKAMWAIFIWCNEENKNGYFVSCLTYFHYLCKDSKFYKSGAIYTGSSIVWPSFCKSLV